MTSNVVPVTGRLAWTKRFALVLIAVLAVLAIVEFLARQKSITDGMLTDVVDIRTPATVAAKVRHLAEKPGKKIILLGDSLTAGQTMRDHGDQDWQKNTISADLQRRFDSGGQGKTSVMNLGMNGILPMDLESMVDGLLLTKPEAIVINVSLRSFSQDFAAPESQNSREWLKTGIKFRPDGTILRLPYQYGPGSSIERSLLNNWTTYRMRDAIRARFIEGEPKDLLQGLKAWLAGKGTTAAPAGPAAEMRLLLQVRSRYANVSLDGSNPQFAAWTRMLEKLKAANQKTIVFYGTESPRLLPSLIDPRTHTELTDQIRLSVSRHGELFQYLGPNQNLKDDVFLDHVHVSAAGNRIYGESLYAALNSPNAPGQPSGQPPGKSLDLKLQSFVETVDPNRTELGKLTDFTHSVSTTPTPETPRFDIKDFPVLSVETRANEAFNLIIFMYHWWAKNDQALGVRDSYHMLRAPNVPQYAYPDDVIASLGGQDTEHDYVDVFEGIPARIGAAKIGFFVQHWSQNNSATISDKSITLYGQSITRADQQLAIKTSKTRNRSSASQFPLTETSLVELPAIKSDDIAGRGVRFSIDDVATVFMLRANHDLVTHAKEGEIILGSLVPQVIGYKTVTNEFRTLSFTNADLTRINFDPVSKVMNVEVYDYEFRERTTRGSMRYPGKNGKRVHRNLGIVPELPAQSLTITHAVSDKLAFPLLQPNGSMATFAITEHADYVGILQDRLTMYGSAMDSLVEGLGLLGNKIPVTKTVFLAGKPYPFKSRTASAAEVGEMTQSSVEYNADFTTVLRKYRENGGRVEIGIHCTFASPPLVKLDTAFVRKAIATVSEFKPVTWVDHGGRDCLWESGWDPKSEHYIIPVLRENKFKYVNMLGDKYDGRLNMIADNQPSNLLFYSVGLDDNLGDAWKPYVFNTVPVGLGKTEFTPEHLQQIVRARGLVNIHTYLPYEATFFEKQPDGSTVLKANPWYNELLGNIAASARSGALHLATNEELNDYILKIRDLHVFASGPNIEVLNPARQTIQGLTIGYRNMNPENQTVAVVNGGRNSGTKMSDGAHYTWFDLRP